MKMLPTKSTKPFQISPSLDMPILAKKDDALGQANPKEKKEKSQKQPTTERSVKTKAKTREVDEHSTPTIEKAMPKQGE